MKINLFLSFVFLSLFLQVENVNYFKNAQKWVDKVYETVYLTGCWHKQPHPSSFDDIKKKKTISCGWSVSITYQQAGLIEKGKKISHTPACGIHNDMEALKKYYDVPDLKKSLELTMTHPEHLKKGSCDLVKVMKKYKDLPAWLQQKGIAYIQNSNICISAGNNKIYSCNSTNKQYGPGKSQVLREDKHHEYAFNSLILWAIVPRSDGKSNVPNDTPFKHLEC